ncbi:MAG: glycosyltransferase family 39 protein [Deltaproteobacteria bacterium]
MPEKYKDILFLAAVSSFLIFYKLGEKSLTTWDEILYAQMAKEMFRGGDWLTPTLNGMLRFEKPPLCTGVTAFFYSLFGISEFSARLFSALSGMATVLVTYLFSRKMFSRANALCASLVLLSSLHFFNHAKLGMMDVPVTFFITISLFFFYLGFERQGYYLIMGFSASCALLTKGIAGGVIFFVIGLILLFSKRWSVLKNKYFILGIFISVSLPAIWLLYEYARFGEILISSFFGENISRIGQALDSHQGTWFSYINTVFYKGKLWGGIALLLGGYLLVREFFSKEKDFRFIFLLSWVFTILIIFSAAKTKLHWYIMPIYPPLFMLFAAGCRHIFKKERWLYALPVLSLIFLGYYQVSHPNKFNSNSNALAKHAALHFKTLKQSGDKLFIVGPLEHQVFLFYADAIAEHETPLKKTEPPSGWVIGYQDKDFLKKYVEEKYQLVDETEGVQFFYR